MAVSIQMGKATEVPLATSVTQLIPLTRLSQAGGQPKTLAVHKLTTAAEVRVLLHGGTDGGAIGSHYAVLTAGREYNLSGRTFLGIAGDAVGAAIIELR